MNLAIYAGLLVTIRVHDLELTMDFPGSNL